MNPETITKYFRSKGFYEHSGSLRFPYTIASTDEVSLDLTEWLQKELLADETVQQRLVIPRQKYFNENPSSVRRLLAWLDWKISPDCVLVLTDQRILLFSVPTNNNPPSLSAASLDAILSVELARILLFAWFEWCWTTQDGLQRSRVYFSTVKDPFFIQLFNRISAYLAGSDLDPRRPPYGMMDELADLPLKFQNHVERVLLPGEGLEGVYFRPALGRENRWNILGKTAPAALLLLSNAYLIWIEEGQQPTSTYGTITRRYLRSNIRGITFQNEGRRPYLVVSYGRSGASNSFRLAVEPGEEADFREVLNDWLTGG